MALDPGLLGPRIEAYFVDVLDQRENRIDVLDGIDDGRARRSGLTDGSVTYNVDSEIAGGGSLSIVNPDLDWMKVRFRPWVLVNDMRWPLGVYMPSAPDEVHTRDGVSVTVSMLDKTSILSSAKLPKTMSVAKKANPVTQVQQILTAQFGFDAASVALTPTTKTLADAITWVPGTSYLKVINDLLAAVAFNRVWCDNLGRFRAEPWVDPKTAVPTMTFAEGETAIHSPDFTVSQDVASVPNRVICTTTGTDTTAGLVSVATNTDPDSPYSFGARGGRWVDEVYDGVEAADQKTLDAIAKKNLANTSTPPWYVSVQHAVVPLKGRDVVRFTSGGIDRLAWINEWAMPSFRAGTLMTGKWLGVTS